MSFPDMGGSVCDDQAEEDGGRWYLCRKEIEENSPSRQDGMDLRKESYMRRSYCRFLQDLGKRFKLPPATIATAIIMCHRFFLRQSHSKNDRMVIATACMFLACKVKETLCSLKDIVVTSYDIVHQKDSEQVRSRIVKDNGFYEKQKEVVLVAERVVLSTLGYDFDVPNPYMPLVEGVKRLFEVGDQKMVAQVAWSLVNDSLRTSLLLQFEAHHVAAGAIFLAAKLLKLKPNRGNELDVVQLDDIINQMLEMYDQVPQDKVGISLKPAPPRTDEAPKPSSCKRKAGDSPDKLADQKQRQRLDYYLSEDRYSDRDHRRHDRAYDRGQRYPSLRRHHYDDHRSEDRWRRGGQREYDRARLRQHEECRY